MYKTEEQKTDLNWKQGKNKEKQGNYMVISIDDDLSLELR